MKAGASKKRNATCTASCLIFAVIFMALGSLLTFLVMHSSVPFKPQNELETTPRPISPATIAAASAASASASQVSSLVSEIQRDQQYLKELISKQAAATAAKEKSASTADSKTTASSPISSINTIAKTASESPASIHPILFLSDDDFRNTPISHMFQQYGQANGGGSCSMDFGYELIEKWRSMKKPYCVGASSGMDCYLIHQTRHHGNGDNLCHMKNVGVQMSIFGEDAHTDRFVREYVDTKHQRQPYIPFPKGFIESDCQPTADYKPQFMPGWNWNVSYEGFSPNTPASACETTIDHNVLIIQRDTFANFFHDSEDFFNYFVSMAVFEWTLADTQVYLTDLYPEGPFWPIWSKVFSGKFKAMTAFDLKNKFGNMKGKVCYKSLAVGIYGPAAPITVASWDTPCSKTALVRSYSDFVIRGLGLHKKTIYNSKCVNKKEVVVTFLARRSSIEWPEKKFCNDTHSFFKCKYWESFGIRKLGRVLRNDGELINGLKALEGAVFPNGAKVKVQDVDFNLLSFEEQIAVDLETDVMIGPHGAGLMHNIFMPDRAGLFELFIDGSSGNRHFHNLANWYGRHYEGIPSQNPINVDTIVSTVKTFISQMKIEC